MPWSLLDPRGPLEGPAVSVRRGVRVLRGLRELCIGYRVLRIRGGWSLVRRGKRRGRDTLESRRLRRSRFWLLRSERSREPCHTLPRFATCICRCSWSVFCFSPFMLFKLYNYIFIIKCFVST